eukprot:6181459-Pleurochrysis_carterae.AAC.1
MIGSAEAGPGVMVLAIQSLFDHMASESAEHRFELRMVGASLRAKSRAKSRAKLLKEAVLRVALSAYKSVRVRSCHRSRPCALFSFQPRVWMCARLAQQSWRALARARERISKLVFCAQSYLEVYNETLRDLLAEGKQARPWPLARLLRLAFSLSLSFALALSLALFRTLALSHSRTLVLSLFQDIPPPRSSLPLVFVPLLTLPLRWWYQCLPFNSFPTLRCPPPICLSLTHQQFSFSPLLLHREADHPPAASTAGITLPILPFSRFAGVPPLSTLSPPATRIQPGAARGPQGRGRLRPLVARAKRRRAGKLRAKSPEYCAGKLRKGRTRWFGEAGRTSHVFQLKKRGKVGGRAWARKGAEASGVARRCRRRCAPTQK